MKMDTKNVNYYNSLLYYFNKCKQPAEDQRKICNEYRNDAVTERVRQRWFSKCCSGFFNINDAPRSCRSTESGSSDVKATVDANPYQNMREIAMALNISHSSVKNHL